MVRIHSFAFVLVSLFQAAAHASAQMPQTVQVGDPATSGVLTRREAVRLALENNPELASLSADARVMAARPDAELGLMPPMLEAQVFSWPLDTGNPANAEIMLMIEQEFPGRGKRQARAERARRAADRAANDTAMRATAVAAEVKRAYADLWLAPKSLDVFDAALALLRQVADAAEAKYITGRSTQQDVVRAIVEIARLEERKLTAREEANLAEARLNTLMNRRADEAVGTLDEPVEQVKIALPIGRSGHDRKKMSTKTRHRKEAVTRWKALMRFRGATLVEVRLGTGRTHQIRVHFSAVGHPVLGDSTYGKKRDLMAGRRRISFPRQMLHAAMLGFQHPRSNEYLEFSSPLPEDMETAIQELTESGSS